MLAASMHSLWAVVAEGWRQYNRTSSDWTGQSDDRSQDVTRLLIAWSNGDSKALDELMPLVYRELQQMAQHQLGRERR